MIIVSQDKETIINFDNVESLWINKDEMFEIRAETHSFNTTVGEYQTEERAKEVLREISNFYEIAKRHECSGNDGLTIYLENRFTYQMPED